MRASDTVAVLAGLLVGGGLSGCAVNTHGARAGAESDGGSVAAAAPVGVFALVAGAPPGFGDLAGTARLVDGTRGGSDVSIALSGLKPNVRYLAHVHEGTCGQPDPGGPHFKFDADGGDTPPNEIHLRFTANATRNAGAQVRSARRVADGAAGSVVVHEDAPASGADGEQPKAAAGHAHHGGGSAGADTTSAGGHSHAAKIACAALRKGGAAGAGTPDPVAGGGPPTAIRVSADKPVGGVQKLAVRKGERVRFSVSSDGPEEVHVHGYDLTAPVGPTTPARFDFAAEIEGIFEVELEGAGVPILSLTVNPEDSS